MVIKQNLILPTKISLMQQYFSLDAKEKKQEWLLLVSAVVSFMIIGKGVYNQYHHIDQNNILIPLLTVMYTCFFFVYGFNAFTTGNLTPKWTPFFIYQVTCVLIKKIGSTTQDRAKIIAIKILGTIALIIALGLFIATIFILRGTINNAS